MPSATDRPMIGDGAQMFGCVGQKTCTGGNCFAFVVDLKDGAHMSMTKSGHEGVLPEQGDKFVDLCFTNGAGDWLCSFVGIPSSFAQNLAVSFVEGG